MSDPFTGEIRMFAGGFAPRSWALCDGQLLAISSNDALFSLVGTTFGGDGRSTFGLPEMRGRVPIHVGTGPGLTPRSWGQRSGAENETITIQKMASHDHSLSASTETVSETNPAGNVTAKDATPNNYRNAASPAPGNTTMASAMVGMVGSTQSHTNMMPFQCLNFIICLFGIYPSRT